MSAAARRVHHSYAEYLALEDESQTRHEYLDGEIYAMAGGTPDHVALATSDLRVRIAATGLSTYPDAAVTCGTTLRAAHDPIAVVNPVLLAEVTSPATEEYDRGEKLRNYKQLPNLTEVLIVSHREPRLTLVRKDEAGRWGSRDAGSGQSVTLASIGCDIAVDDVYRDGLEDSQ